MKLLKIDPNIFDTELDFFPLYEGIKPSSMGLKKLDKFELSQEENKKIFLFGPSFGFFRKSKELCREDNLEKYYQSVQEYPEIIQHILTVLSTQNKEHFSLSKENGLVRLDCLLTQEVLWFNNNYELVKQESKLKVPFKDAFDALAMQVPEDLVIHHVPNGQLNPLKSEQEKRDFAAKIHLTHCNGWDAEWAINQTFNFIHKGVPRIEKIIPNAIRMMMSFFNKDVIYERIAAISFKNSRVLNRHHDYEKLWLRKFNHKNPDMTIRVERQTITGFPKSEAFLFTIRTYIYHMDSSKSNIPSDIKQKRHDSIVKAFENPDEKSYAHDIVLENQKNVLDWLKPEST